jgi:hypothetical protein
MEGVRANGEDDDTTKGPSSPTPLRSAHSSAAPRGAGRADLEQAIAILRARVDEEFRITERLDAKSRQAFTVAAGFFVVAQAVAFGTFGADSVTSPERVIVAVLALIAGACVAATGHRLANSEDLLEVENIRPDAVVEWANSATDDDYVAVRIIANLRDVANGRRENNVTREGKYERVNTAMRWALIFCSVELLLAILVRI